MSRPVNALLILLFLLSMGCVSSGNPNAQREDLISQIRIGQTTRDDIHRMFGQPNSVARGSGSIATGLAGAPAVNGSYEAWNYTHMNVEVDGATFIPIVGLFAGGATSQTSQVTISFDEHGIVRGVQSGHNQGRSGMGTSPTP